MNRGLAEAEQFPGRSLMGLCRGADSPSQWHLHHHGKAHYGTGAEINRRPQQAAMQQDSRQRVPFCIRVPAPFASIAVPVTLRLPITRKRTGALAIK